MTKLFAFIMAVVLLVIAISAHWWLPWAVRSIATEPNTTIISMSISLVSGFSTIASALFGWQAVRIARMQFALSREQVLTGAGSQPTGNTDRAGAILEDDCLYDVLIVHAREDWDIAITLGQQLRSAGLTIWMDVVDLKLHDDLEKRINSGLARSRFGILVVSSSFFGKWWSLPPDLDAVATLERLLYRDGRKRLLPIWHNLKSSKVDYYAPLLADGFSVSTSQGIYAASREIVAALRGLDQAGCGRPDDATTPWRNLQRRIRDAGRDIRMLMLAAKGSRELKPVLYQAEMLLEKFPNDAELRSLKAEIKTAIKEELNRERATFREHARIEGEAIREEVRKEAKAVFQERKIGRLPRLMSMLLVFGLYYLYAHKNVAIALALTGGLTLGGGYYGIERATSRGVSVRQLTAEEAFAAIKVFHRPEALEDFQLHASIQDPILCTGLEFSRGSYLLTADYGIQSPAFVSSAPLFANISMEPYPLALIHSGSKLRVSGGALPPGDYILWHTTGMREGQPYDEVEIKPTVASGQEPEALNQSSALRNTGLHPELNATWPRVFVRLENGNAYLVIGKNRLHIEVEGGSY